MEHSGYIKQQGRVGEKAYMESLAQDDRQAVDLNRPPVGTTADRDRSRANTPLVDALSDEGFVSCKVKGIAHAGSLEDSPEAQNRTQRMYDRYRVDLEKMLSDEHTAKAARVLSGRNDLGLAGLGPNPSEAAIAQDIMERGMLAVPDDHVKGVQDNIERMARQLPGRYGLSSDPEELEKGIQRLRDRVRPMGVTSVYIRQIQERHRSLQGSA